MICHLWRQPQSNENSITGRGNKSMGQDNEAELNFLILGTNFSIHVAEANNSQEN